METKTYALVSQTNSEILCIINKVKQKHNFWGFEVTGLFKPEGRFAKEQSALTKDFTQKKRLDQGELSVWGFRQGVGDGRIMIQLYKKRQVIWHENRKMQKLDFMHMSIAGGQVQKCPCIFPIVGYGAIYWLKM